MALELSEQRETHHSPNTSLLKKTNNFQDKMDSNVLHSNGLKKRKVFYTLREKKNIYILFH